jgi:hypothetical protein
MAATRAAMTTEDVVQSSELIFQTTYDPVGDQAVKTAPPRAIHQERNRSAPPRYMARG